MLGSRTISQRMIPNTGRRIARNLLGSRSVASTSTSSSRNVLPSTSSSTHSTSRFNSLLQPGRSFSQLSNLHQAQPTSFSLPSIQHSSSLSLLRQEDELLSQFDHPIPTTPISPTSTRGLFLNPSFSSPTSFLELTQKTLFRAQLLVNRIIAAPQNGIQEMEIVVRNLDRLSDLLCGVIDFAELIRNASPDQEWVQAANDGYEYLCGYMNVLNTSTGLYDVSRLGRGRRKREGGISRKTLRNSYSPRSPVSWNRNHVFQVLSQVLSTPSLSSTLSSEARAVALVFLRDFEKSGIHLPPQQRSEFVRLSDDILILGREFLQPSSSEKSFYPSKSSSNEADQVPLYWLDGMPISILQALRQSAVKGDDGKGGKELVIPLTSDGWEAQAISKYSPNEKAREKAFLVANSNPNSEGNEKVRVLETLLKKRAELAEVTGNDGSYSRMTLGDKMAKRPEHVENFLRALTTHHRPLAEKNLDLLRSLKKTRSPNSSSTFNAWDRDFYSETLALQTSTRSPVLLSPYLSLGNIFRGLSRLFTKLYGISFKFSPLQEGESWSNKEVIKLEVLDESSGIIGRVYCDLFSRNGKPSNAAHYTVRCSRRVDLDDGEKDFEFGKLDDGRDVRNFEGLRELSDALPVIEGESQEMKERRREMGYQDRKEGGRYQTPVIVLMCDFMKPSVRDGPTLLSWNEVETLFHEMGHAIHSMIGRTEYHNVSGTRCATDFVELPSILMEHFLISPSVLPLFTSHQTSKKPLDSTTLSTYLSTQRSLSSLDTHHQILLASLDQLYHSPKALNSHFNSTKELYNLSKSHGVIPPVPNSDWQTSFGHLFGYGASYYSYLFDRAIAGKVWKGIFEEDPLDRRNGEVFKEKVLKWGGGKDPWEMLADLLKDERIRKGDHKAMEVIG